MIDLTPIFQAVIALLAALISYKLIPWIKAKTTKEQQEAIQADAKIAVFAAEQIYGAGNGEDKLQYALGVLNRAGYNINTTLAREAIEKAVAEMNWEYTDVAPISETVNETPTTEAAPMPEQAHPPEAPAQDGQRWRLGTDGTWVVEVARPNVEEPTAE